MRKKKRENKNRDDYLNEEAAIGEAKIGPEDLQ